MRAVPKGFHVAPDRYRLGLLLVIAVLSGCVGMETQLSESTRAFRHNSAINSWNLRGKIGVKTPEEASSGYLNWYQCDRQFEIRVNGPLGSGAAKLVGDAQQVTLYQSGEPPHSAATAEQLIETQLGWQLPISHLRYWIRGLPSPNERFHATAQGFQQAGWSLAFPRQASVDGYTLPARAIASSASTRVTLVFQLWEIISECGASR